MVAIFSQVLNMSMTGSLVILFVILARLILKRSPKIFSYALWSVVLFRLLCPVAFTAPISVLDVVEPEMKEISNNTSTVSYIPATVNTYVDFVAVPQERQPIHQQAVSEPDEQLRMIPMHAAALVWAAGAVGMLLYSVVQYLLLRRKLIGVMRLNRNIYLVDHIDTAFVVGLVKPKIYLPSSVPAKERYCILAHEQHHIRRYDHVIKLLAYLALCIHWFNPLVWIAFALAGKDMEMSCDEAVIKKLGAEIRADYSVSLLRLATHKKILSGMPLAFGEGDTKGRVLNMAKWKKPTKLLVAICVILCICVVVVCAFNPEKKEELSITELTRHTSPVPVDTAVGDLCFIYPGGLTSELRDVDNWGGEDRQRSLRNLPTRRKYNHFFIDQDIDFGGVVDFIVPDDREIRLEEMNLPTEWVGLDYIAGSSTYPYAEVEYTLIKDGKDYIQLYLYTYSGRGYFLWFYTEQGNPAYKQSILESVELGSFTSRATKLKQDEMVSLGQFNMRILKGYGYSRSENVVLEITRKERFRDQTVVGCVTARPNPNLPLENDSDWVQWVEAVGLNLHLDDVNYGYTITDSGEFGDISLTLEGADGEKRFMSERHYFFIAGDIIYHLWFDAMQMNWADDKLMLESIWIKNVATVPNNNVGSVMQQSLPAINGSDIITDTELIQYGSLKMLLPSSFAAIEYDGTVVLTKESVSVGGICCWNHPGFEPGDMIEWMKALGIPEFQDDFDAPIGYMAGNSAYGGWEIEMFWDGNPDALNEQHVFFIDGDLVYDVWYDQNLISDGIAERFLKTVAINAEPSPAVTPQEQEALEKCKAVVDTVQSGSHHIQWEKRRTSSAGTSGYSVEYLSHDDDWLHITNLKTGTDVERQFRMQIDGKYFYDVQSAVQKNSRWSNGNTVDRPELPWLVSYSWDDSTVAYIDTLQDQGNEIIMLRIDEPFYGYPVETQCYFVNFIFDGSGSFMRVELQVDVFKNNDLWTANEAESIVSLDPEVVNAEIQKEYQRATS